MAKPSLPLPLVIAHQLSIYFARYVAPPSCTGSSIFRLETVLIAVSLAQLQTTRSSREYRTRRCASSASLAHRQYTDAYIAIPLETAGYNALSASVSQLVDCFTTVEALAHVGIPTVYGIHLSASFSPHLLVVVS